MPQWHEIYRASAPFLKFEASELYEMLTALPDKEDAVLLIQAISSSPKDIAEHLGDLKFSLEQGRVKPIREFLAWLVERGQGNKVRPKENLELVRASKPQRMY